MGHDRAVPRQIGSLQRVCRLFLIIRLAGADSSRRRRMALQSRPLAGLETHPTAPFRLGGAVSSMQSVARFRMAIAVSFALAFAGIVANPTMGDETCDSCSEWSLSGRIQAGCHRLLAREPYRPYDDHFPRFHPVPVSPVFPSLYEPASAAGATVRSGEPSQRKIGPAVSPHQLPAPFPELVPTPPAKSGGGSTPARPAVPREASRRAVHSVRWIFLPAATPAPKDEWHLERGGDVASEGGRLVR